MPIDRRDAIKAASLGLIGAGLAAPSAEAAPPAPPRWKRGKDNQRNADLGDGRFLNPILAGDRPDPAILKQKRLRQAALGVVVFIVIIGVSIQLARMEPAAPNVELATVLVDTVKRGSIVRQVRGLGSQKPTHRLSLS